MKLDDRIPCECKETSFTLPFMDELIEFKSAKDWS